MYRTLSVLNSHPELREGEVFITNIDEERYSTIPYQTKRRGTCSYNRDRQIIDNTGNIFPVFAQESEVVKINPNFWEDRLHTLSLTVL